MRFLAEILSLVERVINPVRFAKLLCELGTAFSAAAAAGKLFNPVRDSSCGYPPQPHTNLMERTQAR